MRKIALILFVFSFGLSWAEEGMLIPSVIQAFESDMKARGMKLSAQDIYDVNNASLKDAILHFGGGCTAELVSDKGLLLTNHHCGFGQIQSHSSLENDYLKNGFWAKTYADELANPGLFVARMVRIEDVTKDVNFGISDNMSAAEKMAKIKANSDKLIEDAERGTHYKAEIKPFNYGNDFYIIVKEVFNDVRLVGAPPSSVGKFGGDTDNWVWPRHTGDFSVFRVYAGKDNKPAEYNAENQPYKPLHFLPVSMLPRKQGEFTMVYGFPGTTEQHLVSAQIKHIIEKERPARIAMRESSLSVIDAGMRSSDELRIKYAAKQARIANAYKKWIGQVDGLISLGAVDVKESYEKKYVDRANSKPEWKKYAQIVGQMKTLVEENKEYDYRYAVNTEYLGIGAEIFRLARSFTNLETELNGISKEDLEAKKASLTASIEGFFKDFDATVDKNIFIKTTQTYIDLVGKDKVVELIQKNGITKEAEIIYAKSFLSDKERALDFVSKLSGKSWKKIKNDPGMMLYFQVYNEVVEEIIPAYRAYLGSLNNLLKEYVAGKYEMFPNDKHWADANSTMRITYGALEGSAPTDGMMYTEHTTADGILAKNRTGNPDFELLPSLKDKFEKREYGPYAQGDDLWVCFTGSNHTTGGNSGSPVIDGEGRLMGLNFDRTWESTMSDYMFDPSRCRNVVVDIRYVLWVMDTYAGAGHLVKEMNLVKE